MLISHPSDAISTSVSWCHHMTFTWQFCYFSNKFFTYCILMKLLWAKTGQTEWSFILFLPPYINVKADGFENIHSLTLKILVYPYLRHSTYQNKLCVHLFIRYEFMWKTTMWFDKIRPEVINLEIILRLKIKRNDWLADTCPQAANHCALFWLLWLYSSFITSKPGNAIKLYT